MTGINEVMQSGGLYLYQCQKGTEIDSYLNGQREEETQMVIVLAKENQHSLIKHMHIAERGLLG